MKNINTWQELETFVIDFFKKDKPKTTPGSGNSKNEEDVIGDITMSQCKFTENINSSILEKDMSRLLESAKQRHRTPFFFNKSAKYTTITINIDESNYENISNLMYTYALYYNLKNLNDMLNNINDPRSYEYIKSDINKNIKNIKNSLIDINNLVASVQNTLEVKFHAIMNYDLFK